MGGNDFVVADGWDLVMDQLLIREDWRKWRELLPG